MIGLNVGSGQRRFETTPEVAWTNVDCLSREGQVPDVIDDARTLATFPDGNADVIVLCHVLEHFVLPEGGQVIQACHRVLKPGGELLISLPNVRVLSQRWLMGAIDDYIFFVNCMGAYQGEEGDCHRWHYTRQSLEDLLHANGNWQEYSTITDSRVPLPVDWWISNYRAVKK